MSLLEPRSFLERVIAQRNAEQMAQKFNNEPLMVACVDCGHVRRAKANAGLRCFRCKNLQRAKERRNEEARP